MNGTNFLLSYMTEKQYARLMHIAETWKGNKNLKLIRLLYNKQLWLVEEDIIINDSESLAIITFQDRVPPPINGEMRIWVNMMPIV